MKLSYLEHTVVMETRALFHIDMVFCVKNTFSYSFWAYTFGLPLVFIALLILLKG